LGRRIQMFCIMSRVSIFALVFLLISGCGGGSGGGTSSGGGGNPPPPPPPATITFTVTGPAPTAIATQIGSAPFAPATLTSGAVTLTLPSGTVNFAVAFVCPASSVTDSSAATQQTNEYVYEASTADGTSFAGACPSASTTSTTGATGTLTGTVDASAIPGAWGLDVFVWNGNAEVTGFPSGLDSSFSFAAPQGNDTVNVAAYSSTLEGTNNNEEVLTLVAAKSFSGQAVPGALNGGNPVVLGVGDEPVAEPITYSGVPSGFSAPDTIAEYSAPGVGGIFLTNSAGTEYPVVPAGAALTGGYYQFTSAAYGYLSVTPYMEVNQEVGVNKAVAMAGPVSITFPTAWAYPGPTPAPLPVFDFSNSGISVTGSGFNELELLWPIDGQATDYYLQIAATENYMSGGTKIAVPDMSSMSGFLSSPTSGQLVSWNASVSSGGFPGILSSSNGNNITFVQNSGLYNEP
jgi:hypothetical protein